MTDSTDAALAADGDYVAFERLFRKYLSRIYSLCARLSGSRERGADLTEDAFARAWEKLPEFRGERTFASWLRRLATEVALSGGESGGRLTPDDGSTATGRGSDAGGFGENGRPDVGEALDGLPADARTILVLHDVEGYKYDEIAEILGITVGGTKARLHRARVLLREVLRQ